MRDVDTLLVLEGSWMWLLEGSAKYFVALLTPSPSVCANVSYSLFYSCYFHFSVHNTNRTTTRITQFKISFQNAPYYITKY